MPVILIADDEENTRAGIRKILSETLPGDMVYREAKNGEEALALVKTGGVDLLITDIRMPKMDGLELMRAIRTDLGNSGLGIIILSGYDDFSYAQKAIALRAASYILKPADKRELVPAVLKALGEKESREKEELGKQIRDFIETGRVPEGGIPVKISAGSPAYFIALDPPPGGQSGACVVEDGGGCRCILAGEEEKDRLRAEARQGGGRVVISGGCKSPASLVPFWRQLRIACFGRLLSEERVLEYRESDPPLDRSGVEAEVRKLTGGLGIAGTALLKKQVEALFSLEDLRPAQRQEYLWTLQELYLSRIAGPRGAWVAGDMYLTRKHRLLENAALLPSLDEWKKHLSDFIIYLNFRIKRDHPRRGFIEDALAWIDTHFTEDINMTVVANQVSVNYTYFSEKFKEHTGLRFNDYLKRLRIGMAMRLLETGNYKVYEAALHSGYRDVKYFLKTFKELAGVSPGVYRLNKDKGRR